MTLLLLGSTMVLKVRVSVVKILVKLMLVMIGLLMLLEFSDFVVLVSSDQTRLRLLRWLRLLLQHESSRFILGQSLMLADLVSFFTLPFV